VACGAIRAYEMADEPGIREPGRILFEEDDDLDATKVHAGQRRRQRRCERDEEGGRQNERADVMGSEVWMRHVVREMHDSEPMHGQRAMPTGTLVQCARDE
jgi:hypothetical protein